MTRSGSQERPLVDLHANGELVRCTLFDFADLISQASRASSLLVERHGGLVRPPMLRFRKQLEAVAVTSRKYSGDRGHEIRRYQLEKLYEQICLDFGAHALAGRSLDEETMCLVFTDPSILECDIRLKSGNVLRLVVR